MKILKNRNSGVFCNFRCQFEIFGVIWETATIFSEMPAGQPISAMLGVFNLLIHEVYRKFD